jgi:hypothetical protein
MAYYAPPPCPACQERVLSLDHNGLHGECGQRIHIPTAYFRLLWALASVTVGLFGIVTYPAEHRGAWLLFLIVLLVPLRIIAGIVTPPWFRRGLLPSHVPFWPFYLAAVLTSVGYTWSLLGWLYVFLGASKGEMRDHLDLISLPLGWLNSSFLVRPDKSFLDLLGVIAANSFFFAILFFLPYSVVRWFMQRSDIAKMNLSLGPEDHGDTNANTPD